MKGLVFNEFLDFVEQTMSYEMVDTIITKSNLKSRGIYTSIGTYDAQELLDLISALSDETHVSSKHIQINYGKFLFKTFAKKYSHFFQHKPTVFQFLNTVETHIHADVKKYYPDATLPHFKCTEIPPDKFIMVYTSVRPMADLAEGLIIGCISYHEENITIHREDIPLKNKTCAKFTLTKRKSL